MASSISIWYELFNKLLIIWLRKVKWIQILLCNASNLTSVIFCIHFPPSFLLNTCNPPLPLLYNCNLPFSFSYLPLSYILITLVLFSFSLAFMLSNSLGFFFSFFLSFLLAFFAYFPFWFSSIFLSPFSFLFFFFLFSICVFNYR